MQMELAQVLCCLCGTPMAYNPSSMCLNCLKNRVDITEGIPKQAIVHMCKECFRFLRPPWIVANLESPELLQLCLKKLKNLNKVKLIDASWIWTESHSRRLKIKLTIQKEVHLNTTLEQTFVVEYVVQTMQCDDCKKTYTPHSWVANVQVRQKVDHQRTFYYLEQLMLKNSAHDKVISIKQKHQGVDFHFVSKSHAIRLVDFIQSVTPVQVKHAKQLISHDANNNSYNYKYTYSVEIASICKDDLLLIPKEYNMGIGPLALCYKVSNSIHIVDPITMQMGEIQSDKYWKHPIRSFTFTSQLVEFIVIDIEEEHMPWHRQLDLANECDTSTASTRSMAFRHRPGYNRFKKVEVEVARADDMNLTYRLNSHLGHVLRVGDSVLGYDLTRLIGNSVEQEDLSPNTPDVILIKKIYTHLKKTNRKRVFKLQRMQVDKQKEEGYEEFMDEIEQDPEMRTRINLYYNKQAKPEDFKEQHEDETFPGVQLEELLENLTLEDRT